jgi:nitroreductase
MADELEALSRIVRRRRTVNDFNPEPPPESAVWAALELAVWAPNHKLTQPWQFHLLGARTVQQVIDLNSRLVAASKGAEAAESKRQKWSSIPGWLAVTHQRVADPLRAREDYAACCCAVQNLLLGLEAQGIGSKWSTGEVTREREFLELLGLDAGTHEVVGLVWYGYPAQRPAGRRRPVAEVVNRLP